MMENSATVDTFIDRVKNVYENCAGNEEFGSTTEFYDEDGVVLMTCTEQSSNVLTFTFPDGESYDYQQKT